MSWYYAGADAKPVGPVTLEELQARRVSGVVGPETYIIEHAADTGPVGGWRRYQEVFAATAPASILPPVPPPLTPPLFGSSLKPPAIPAPHSLFPSAGSVPLPQPAYTPTLPPQAAAPHAHYAVGRTNTLCAWGFGLALAGFLLSPFCGIGLLLAAPALLLCLIGFIQARAPQPGRGLAVAGGGLALLGVIISICLLVYVAPMIMKYRSDSGQQQSSE